MSTIIPHINTLTEKTTSADADLILIEDSGAANAKKKVQRVNLLALPTIKFTTYGGLAILCKADEALNEGEVVSIYQSGTALDVRKSPTSGDTQSMPIGAVLATVSDQADVWIVIAGIAKVLPESGVTAAIGNVAYTSGSEAGRAAQSSTVPTSEHWREIGHWLETGAGNGTLARCCLHFN